MMTSTALHQTDHSPSFSQRYHARIRQGWRGIDLHDQIERMATLGFSGIEFFVDGVGYGDLGGTSRLHLARIQQTIKRFGMRAMVTTHSTDPTQLRRAIRIGAIIGAEQVRTTVSAMEMATTTSPDPERSQNASDKCAYQSIARDIRSIAALLEANGMSLRLSRGKYIEPPLLAGIVASIDHPMIDGDASGAAESAPAKPLSSVLSYSPGRWRENFAKMREQINERRFRPALMPWAINEATAEGAV